MAPATLALGVGLNAATFRLARSVLPLPCPRAARIGHTALSFTGAGEPGRVEAAQVSSSLCWASSLWWPRRCSG